jgi:hypothetical protein
LEKPTSDINESDNNDEIDRQRNEDSGIQRDFFHCQFEKNCLKTPGKSTDDGKENTHTHSFFSKTTWHIDNILFGYSIQDYL